METANAEARVTQFEIVTRNAPVGIFTTADNGDCTFVNERWCALAGITPAQAMGTGWGAALHPDDRARVFSEWYRCAAAHVPFSAEYRFQRPDGRVSWVYGNAVRQWNPDGSANGFVGCIWDVTERKHDEKTLQRVIDAVTPITGLDFFRSLANQMCAACDVDYVIVDTFEKGNPSLARTLACSRRGSCSRTSPTTCGTRRARRCSRRLFATFRRASRRCSHSTAIS